MWEIKLYKRTKDGNKSNVISHKAKYITEQQAKAAYTTMRRISIGHCIVPCFEQIDGKRVIDDKFTLQGLKMCTQTGYIIDKPVLVK